MFLFNVLYNYSPLSNQSVSYSNSFYTFNIFNILFFVFIIISAIVLTCCLYYLKGRIFAKAFLDEIDYYKN